MSVKKTEIGFWDASLLIPLCCSQPKLTVIARRFTQRFTSKVAWWGTSVEIHSALDRLFRKGNLSQQDYDKALRRWEVISDAIYWIEPQKLIKDIAETLPKTYGLRALDSFQLAAALVWCKEKPRNRIFVCYDIKLTEAAEKVGFTVLGV